MVYRHECAGAAFRADTVPIYWGDAAIADMFNPARFINVNNMTFKVLTCDLFFALS
jgi:hypothetical protein